MTERTEKFVRALLLPINPAVVVLLGIFTTVWGFWVANPFWTVFSQAALFNAMNSAEFVQWVGMIGISPEVFWGGIAMVCGVFIIHGAVKRSYKSLIRGSTIAFFHWLAISIMFFLGDWMNTGGITAGIFAIYGAFLWVNIRVNFKESHNMDDVLR